MTGRTDELAGQRDRERILSTLWEALEPHPQVHAMWLEGADALGTVDAHSDIDVWLSVEDGYEDAVLARVREALRAVAPLGVEHETPHPHLLLRQVFFHLEGTSKFLLLDLCLQSRSRDVAFQKGVDAVRVVFDKTNVVRYEKRDEAAEERRLRERAEALAKEFVVRQVWVEKNLRRGLFLEALGAYHAYSLRPLVELLRIIYAPHKRDFGFKDVDRDLPRDVVETLEPLHKVASLDELAARHQQVCSRFEALSEVLRLRNAPSSQEKT